MRSALGLGIVIALALAACGPGVGAAPAPAPAPSATRAVWDALDRLEAQQRWAAAESLTAGEIARQRAATPVDSLELSRAMLHFANARFKRRLYGDGRAFDALERALAIRERHVRGPDSLQVWGHVLAGTCYSDADLPARGIPHGEAAIRMIESATPVDTAQLSQAHLGLALCLGDVGRPDDARPHYERALVLRQALAGADSPRLIPMLANYGVFLADQGDNDGARERLERARRIAERDLPNGSANLEGTLMRISTFEDRLGDVAESLELAERCYELGRARLGPDHVETLRMAKTIGNRLNELGDYPGEAALLRDVVPRLEASAGAYASSVLNTRLSLINAWLCDGDTLEAVPALALARDALAHEPELRSGNEIYYLQLVADLAHARGDEVAARDTLREAIRREWRSRGHSGGKRAILYEHWMATVHGPADRAALDEATRDIARLTDSTYVTRTSTWEPLLLARAGAEARVGLRDSAWVHAGEAEVSSRDELAYQLRALPDDHALAFARHLGAACPLLVALARPDRPDEVGEAWGRIVHWRGVVGHEIARRRRPSPRRRTRHSPRPTRSGSWRSGGSVNWW